jgi:hypothetical protein
VTDASPSTSGHKVSRADLEAKFREVQTELSTSAEAAKGRVMTIGAVALVVLILLSFLLGRRAGKKKSTIVEIRRL